MAPFGGSPWVGRTVESLSSGGSCALLHHPLRGRTASNSLAARAWAIEALKRVRLLGEDRAAWVTEHESGHSSPFGDAGGLVAQRQAYSGTLAQSSVLSPGLPAPVCSRLLLAGGGDRTVPPMCQLDLPEWRAGPGSGDQLVLANSDRASRRRHLRLRASLASDRDAGLHMRHGRGSGDRERDRGGPPLMPTPQPARTPRAASNAVATTAFIA